MSFIYDRFKQAMMEDAVGASLEAAGTDIKVVLLNVTGTGTLYVPTQATHEFITDVPVAARIATSGNLTGKAVSGRNFNADDITLTAVTGAAGEAVLLFIDTGTASTSRLICYLDEGVMFSPDGNNITVTWSSSGIFDL